MGELSDYAVTREDAQTVRELIDMATEAQREADAKIIESIFLPDTCSDEYAAGFERALELAANILRHGV